MKRWLIVFRTVIILFLTSFHFLSFIPIASSTEPELQRIEGKIKEGSTFSQSLAEKRIPLQWVDLIVSKLKSFVDFNRIKEGTFQLAKDEKGNLLKFIFEMGLTEVYEIERDVHGAYVTRRKEISLKTDLVKLEGEIHSSLARAIKTAGEQSSLAIAIAEVLAWKIDFAQEVRRGDRFKVIVEKVYKGDQFIKYGTIYAVEYQGGGRLIRGIKYKDGYYDDNGIPLEKAFLKSPLRYDHISSGFNRKRRHPIMGGIHPHLGIDYAAPTGTPVWAVAGGMVVSCGWIEGFGKQVILRHPNGYTSYYSHLSRYGPGVKSGKRVEQKQVIGYVGSTGFSTGPHLDYRVSKNGQFINPLKETFPSDQPIGEKDREAFRKKKDEILTWLKGDTPFEGRSDRTAGDVGQGI